MLYESTKNLLQSILLSLETGGESRWDDQTESGNACLYEMHQMCGPLYKAYRSDNLNAGAALQGTFPAKLVRAMPHVRLMMIAIRHKDQIHALESGRAALSEMNGTSLMMASGSHGPESRARKSAHVTTKHEEPVAPTGKRRSFAGDRSPGRNLPC
jgi:hypothetical protein